MIFLGPDEMGCLQLPLFSMCLLDDARKPFLVSSWQGYGKDIDTLFAPVFHLGKSGKEVFFDIHAGQRP